jgi:dTDP-4-amino-4,6-dideoxygalactose transaminase
MRVPFLDLQIQYQQHKEELDAAIQQVLDTSAYVGGPAVGAFEEDFAAYIGASYVLGVANGTDSLFLALKACGVGVGDEVITAANTFIATAEAISMTGAGVVLVDCDPDSYTIDPKKIEDAITPQTKAIIPVHLYGQPADMDSVMEIARKHDLKVVEDACQAHGATFEDRRVGTIGDVGCFSCYPGKNLGAYGDAGIAVTNDEEIARKIRLIQNHGGTKKYVHEVVGWNSRLDTIQAAVLQVKLRYLDEWNAKRNEHAAAYQELMADLPVRVPRVINKSHVWHLFVIEVDQRDDLAKHLAERGVATGIHYPSPLHLTEAYADLPYGKGSFPVAEASSERILSLPMYPEMTREQIEHVVDAIHQFSVVDSGVRQ